MSPATPLTIEEPGETPKGGLVVLQHAFGVNGHIQAVCRRLADEGWLAVAPHLFHRTGDPALDYTDMESVTVQMRGLTAVGILDDVDAALAGIGDAGIPLARTGVVGFCMGGTAAVAVVARRDVGAAVSLYGGSVTKGRWGFGAQTDEIQQRRAPWLGLFGDLDETIPPSEVEQLRVAAGSSPGPAEIVRYADAGHAFLAEDRPSFHQPSADDAWARLLAWFHRYLAA